VADEKKQIPKYHENLEIAVQNLHAAISDLAETLAPLMYEPVPKGPPADEAVKREAMVPYAKFICDRCESVEAAIAKIRDIKRRLQV